MSCATLATRAPFCLSLTTCPGLQLSVCAACAVIAFLMSDLSYYTNADKYPSTYLSSPLLPVILSAATGYLVAQMFFSVRHCFSSAELAQPCAVANRKPVAGV